jgi:hypothetical protein
MGLHLVNAVILVFADYLSSCYLSSCDRVEVLQVTEQQGVPIAVRRIYPVLMRTN